VKELESDRVRLQCYVQAGRDIERNLSSTERVISFSLVHEFPTRGRVALSCGFSNRTEAMARALIYELSMTAIMVGPVSSSVETTRKEAFAWGGGTYRSGDLRRFVREQLGADWRRYSRWASLHPGADAILGP
jgi:hypothetical protein